MSVNCNQNPYNVSGWFPESIRFRFACTQLQLQLYVHLLEGTNGVIGATVSIPQLKSFDRITNRTEGKKLVLSGTCGNEVKIGPDIYNRQYKFDFVRLPRSPIQAGYLIAGDCWWFEWYDCQLRMGERFYGQVAFEDNQTIEVGATDEVREIVTIDVTGNIFPFYLAGATNIEGFDPGCLPAIPGCSEPVGGSCMPFACACYPVAQPSPVPSSST